MSYCRWSSDNWKCDVYCYAYCFGGYRTHVAANRVVGEVPIADFCGPPEDFVEQHKAQMAFLETCERKAIELPYAGESFNDATLEEFRDRLISLRTIGYNVPHYVFEEIDAEIAEAA